MLFLYKHNIIYVACITYKQIGGSKQYVQPGAIGIFNVLCSLNHAVLRGKKLHWKKNRNCSIYVFNVLHDYIWNELSPNVCFQNECDTHTHTLPRKLSIDSAKETHTDSMPFQRRMFCNEMKASLFLSRHHERALLHLNFLITGVWELGNDCQSTCLNNLWSLFTSYASLWLRFVTFIAISRGC